MSGLSTPRVVIYTDGACSGNPGPGGWAAVMLYGEHRKELSGGAARTTNNIMELTAAIQALQQLTRRCQVDLYTDSQYLVKGMTEWMPGWLRKGWRRQGGKDVANRTLWEELNRLARQHDIHWNWIPAYHDDPVASHPENDRCDILARQAILDLEAATG